MALEADGSALALIPGQTSETQSLAPQNLLGCCPHSVTRGSPGEHVLSPLLGSFSVQLHAAFPPFRVFLGVRANSSPNHLFFSFQDKYEAGWNTFTCMRGRVSTLHFTVIKSKQ